jgi:hypothetical protein
MVERLPGATDENVEMSIHNFEQVSRVTNDCRVFFRTVPHENLAL